MESRQFEIKMTCDNAAFEEDAPAEVASILRWIARDVERGRGRDECYQTIRDSNGNDIGRWRLKVVDPETGRT